MKVKKDYVSGTGNGVGEDNIPAFINALKDFEKLIRRIYKQYEKNPKETFGNKYHLINNWHNVYKIDLRSDEFPYHMCNGMSFHDGGWNHMHLVVKFPLSFKAPTFSGGETKDMSVALVTQIHLGKESMSEFFENKEIPENLKLDILRELKEFYKHRIFEKYEDDRKYIESQISSRKQEIKESEEIINTNQESIPKLEKRARLIDKKLNDLSKAEDSQ